MDERSARFNLDPINAETKQFGFAMQKDPDNFLPEAERSITDASSDIAVRHPPLFGMKPKDLAI